MSKIWFFGSFEHQLDDAGRVSLPAQFRKKVPEGRFVLMQVYETHLSLYAEERFEELARELASYRKKSDAHWRNVRNLLQHAVPVTTDKNGRILIPQNLRERVGLDGTAFLLGNLNCIELWHPQTWTEHGGGKEAPPPKIDLDVFG